MKVLNLYAGIGGNRKLWEDVEVTAVENNEDIAKIYQDYFPNDEMIVGDAHQYLLDHFEEFDFIWSSPPCQTHSRINKNFGMVRYSDMKLYQEIILLDSWFDGKYCVENVWPYYNPLITPQQNGRHLFWCNFPIKITDKRNSEKQLKMVSQKTKHKIKKIEKWMKDGDVYNNYNGNKYGFDISKYKLDKKSQVVSNLVDPETALMILNCARNIITKSTHQTEMF